MDAALAVGESSALVPELERLLREQPFQERLWVDLILALYRSGQQTQALAAYRRARHTLVEQLGVEPVRNCAWLRPRCSLTTRRLARALVSGALGDLERGRGVAREAADRVAAVGSTYLRAGFLAQLGFIETSAGEWSAALVALREVADILRATKVVDFAATS